MSNNFRKMTRAVAWLMSFGLVLQFAGTVQAIEFFPTPSRFQWTSQSGTLSTDGKAHEVRVNAGDTVAMSLTVKNRATDPKALVWYGKGTLLEEVAPYRGAHEIRLGVKNDQILSWVDASSFIANPDGAANRLAVYSGASVNVGQDMTFTWNLKIAAGTADGTYDLYTGIVREFDARMKQVTASGKVLSSGDIFWRIIIGQGTQVGGGDLNIALASDTPASGNVAIGAVDIVMAKINFSANTSANALISSIVVRRTGLSADDDIADIKLYDGGAKLGSTQGLNTTTHKATFTGLSWLISAGTTKTLTIKGTFPSTADTGKIVALGIDTAASIILSGGGTVAGTFPSYGNEFTVGGISVGVLDIDVQTTPAADNLVSGTTDQAIASFKFAASSVEGFDVNSITFTEIGSSVDSDVLNMKLKIVGNQIGITQASLANGEVTFTGSPLFSVTAGQSQAVYIYADIASGITSTRTVRFEINDTPDVIARGQNSGGTVTITKASGGSGTAFTAQQGATMTIVQGELTVALDPTNLATQEYIVGEAAVEISKFKFSASSREGIKITKLIFNEIGDATSSDYQNAALYIDDSATPVANSGSISTTTITFEDTNGLFTIAKSGNTVVTLKVDVSSSAAATDTFDIGIGTADDAYTNITAYGLISGDKMAQNSTYMTMNNVSNDFTPAHTIAAYGTLVVSSGSNTPAAANYALGETAREFLQFKMQATSEAMRVTSLIARFYDDDSSTDAYTAADEAATGDVTNVKLYYLSGTTWTLLAEVSSPSGGVASYTFDRTIAKNTTVTFKLVGDIPTTSAASYLYADIGATTGATTGVTAGADLTTTGISSGVGITETGSADGNLFTKVAPTITATMSTIPAARNMVINSSNQLLARLFLTANAVEDIKVSTLRISVDDTAISGNGGASAASANFSNVYLGVDTNPAVSGYELTTIPKAILDNSTCDYILYSGADFNAPATWKIPSGGTLIVDIVGDAIGNSTAWSFGMVDNDPTTSIVGSGASSGTGATITGLTSAITSSVLTLTTGGTLAVVNATDTPTVQMVTASYGSTVTAPTFQRIKLSATDEAIGISRIRITTSADGVDDNFNSAANSVKVYEGGTMSGNTLTGGTLVGQGTLITVTGAADETDITISPEVVVSKDGIKYLTIVADLSSIADGADSGDVPKIGIDESQNDGNWDTNYSGTARYNIKATGKSSGTVLYTASSSADLLSNAAYIVKTKLGMAVNAASPSGTATRQANHTILKLNATNTSADTDARFRAGAQNAMTALTTDFTGANTDNGIWTESGNSTIAASATAYIDSANSLKVTVGVDTNPTVLYTFSGAQDLSGYTGMGVWVNASDASHDLTVTLEGSDGSHTINSGANDQWEFFFIPFASATTPFTTGLTTVEYISIAGAGVTAADTIYLDSFVLYKDYIKVNLSSNAGLYATTGLTTNPAITLKDSSSGTTLVTGYVNGALATTFVSTSSAAVYFFPTTEMAIPASGKTYNIVADTTVLMTATSKDLSMSISLGSASTAGAITAGDVLWNDNSATTGIGWIESVDSPLNRSLNF